MVLIASHVQLEKMFQALFVLVLAQPWRQPFLTILQLGGWQVLG